VGICSNELGAHPRCLELNGEIPDTYLLITKSGCAAGGRNCESVFRHWYSLDPAQPPSIEMVQYASLLHPTRHGLRRPRYRNTQSVNSPRVVALVASNCVPHLTCQQPRVRTLKVSVPACASIGTQQFVPLPQIYTLIQKRLALRPSERHNSRPLSSRPLQLTNTHERRSF
jgi:hypothetical protein